MKRISTKFHLFTIALILILLCINCVGFTQEFELDSTFEGTFFMVKTDNLGNLYAINQTSIRKYQPNDVLSTQQFNSKFFGKIDDVSTENPFKIIVLNRDFKKLVFLDNTLTKTNDIIDLNQLNIQDPLLICVSYDAGFWIYDQFNAELKKFDKNLTEIATSGNLQHIIGLKIQPTQIVETSKNLILLDATNGAFLFDLFGGYIKPLFAENNGFGSISGDCLFLTCNGQLIQVNLNNFTEKKMQLPISEFLFFSVYKKSLYLLTQQGIKKYHFR